MTETQHKLIRDEAVISTKQDIIDLLRSPEARDRIMDRWRGDVTVFEAVIAEIEDVVTNG